MILLAALLAIFLARRLVEGRFDVSEPCATGKLRVTGEPEERYHDRHLFDTGEGTSGFDATNLGRTSNQCGGNDPLFLAIASHT